jgi:clan AA aspartic protease
MTVTPLSLPTPEPLSVQEAFPMGLIYADIELLNADDLALLRRGYLQEGQIRKMKVRALVDSGAYMLAINENIKLQLDLPILDEQVAELADGSNIKLEIVGPVEVRFENRATTCRAMVLPGKAEILLGSLPMEDMDVLVNPREQRLIVNPESPYLAKKPLK